VAKIRIAIKNDIYCLMLILSALFLLIGIVFVSVGLDRYQDGTKTSDAGGESAIEAPAEDTP